MELFETPVVLGDSQGAKQSSYSHTPEKEMIALAQALASSPWGEVAPMTLKHLRTGGLLPARVPAARLGFYNPRKS